MSLGILLPHAVIQLWSWWGEEHKFRNLKKGRVSLNKLCIKSYCHCIRYTGTAQYDTHQTLCIYQLCMGFVKLPTLLVLTFNGDHRQRFLSPHGLWHTPHRLWHIPQRRSSAAHLRYLQKVMGGARPASFSVRYDVLGMDLEPTLISFPHWILTENTLAVQLRVQEIIAKLR